jgi:3-oxoacid CoA-transferase
MDLVGGARRVIVTMTATTSSGEPKIVETCTYPLTARGAVDVVVTELSVFRVRDGSLFLTELLGDAGIDEVSAVTAAPFTLALEDTT